ncbi:SDR family NAD(P)-dependent oxidoreductase [Jannaschia sp. LMIT008]|uniref:SDR family NAD(P)-dependent oxidoreductase n=1 Tax=Jannaschia maritima TaxID=3032585 RepID=UPI002810F973|nr:SDR family NAD(P)-dependent oxidoreductase [Jannaschia sp. LMIT008]
MNRYDYEGRRAVVTGGCNGIGAAVAERMAASGARVTLWDLDPDAPEPRVADLNAIACDVADMASVRAAMDRTGPVDVLVNSAGIAGPTHSLLDYPLDDWARIQRVNVDGTLHCCKAVLPGMTANGYGRIVNVASIAGKEGNPMASAYSASKAAVIALTKSLGKEMAETGDIAVNCVTPATAQTRILEQVSAEFTEYMRSKIPRGRFVTVDEIASMILWVASAENSFTTGFAFDLSGGRATY